MDEARSKASYDRCEVCARVTWVYERDNPHHTFLVCMPCTADRNWEWRCVMWRLSTGTLVGHVHTIDVDVIRGRAPSFALN